MERAGWIGEAISLYEERNVDYVDAFNAVFARETGLEAVYSYDRDFERLPDVGRIESS